MKAYKTKLPLLLLIGASLVWAGQAHGQTPPPTPLTALKDTILFGINLNKVSEQDVEGVWREGQLWKTYPLTYHNNVIIGRHRQDVYTPYVPIFMDATINTNQDWTDWNRLDYGVTFIPSGSSNVRSFIDIHAVYRRQDHWVYTPVSVTTSTANGKTTTVCYYDLTKPPINMIFNRAMYEQYFGKIHTHNIFEDLLEPGRFFFTLGISPDGFQLGSTSSSATDASKATYLIGGAYAFNPYVYLNYGLVTSDGKRYNVGFGISFDVGILGKIFK